MKYPRVGLPFASELIAQPAAGAELAQLPTLGQTAKNVKFVDIPKAARLPAEVNPLAGVEVKR